MKILQGIWVRVLICDYGKPINQFANGMIMKLRN